MIELPARGLFNRRPAQQPGPLTQTIDAVRAQGDASLTQASVGDHLVALHLVGDLPLGLDRIGVLDRLRHLRGLHQARRLVVLRDRQVMPMMVGDLELLDVAVGLDDLHGRLEGGRGRGRSRRGRGLDGRLRRGRRRNWWRN